MPARKPKALIKKHETAAEKRARESREAALRPAGGLPMGAPSRLKDHPAAAAAWRRLMKEFDSVQGEIVTRLDMDLLLDYCILMEQTIQLDNMRKVAYKAWLQLACKHEQLTEDEDFDKAVLMATKVVGAFDAIVKLDSRVDRKRSLMLQLRQSLYLTPRARAGAAPAKKEPEEPLDEMSKLLGEVTDYVNGKGDDR